MLKTEMRNPDTYGIEKMSALEIVSVINQENNNVIKAIDETLPQIADACRSVENVIQNGGRVFYIGVRLIHGCHGGTALRDMIRKDYRKHPKVLRLELGSNSETDLVLREW